MTAVKCILHDKNHPKSTSHNYHFVKWCKLQLFWKQIAVKNPDNGFSPKNTTINT